MSNIIKSSNIIEEIGSKKVEKLVDFNREEYILEAKKKYNEIMEKTQAESNKIIEEASSKAETYLNQAYERAKQLFEEQKIKGFEEGFEKGYNEGYEKGYSEGKEESDKLIKEELEVKNEYLNMKKNILKSTEEDIINLVITICEKVINQKLEFDNEMIVNLVYKGIESLNATDNLTIIVSKEDYDIVDMFKDKILARASLIENIEIKVDSKLNKGDCILETSKGNVDVSVTYQLDEVKSLLINMLNSE